MCNVALSHSQKQEPGKMTVTVEELFQKRAAREGLSDVVTCAGSLEWTQGVSLTTTGGPHISIFSKLSIHVPTKKLPSSPPSANTCSCPWLQKTDVNHSLFEQTYTQKVIQIRSNKRSSILWVLLKRKNKCVLGMVLYYIRL